jgi:hypothetical protein
MTKKRFATNTDTVEWKDGRIDFLEKENAKLKRLLCRALDECRLDEDEYAHVHEDVLGLGRTIKKALRPPTKLEIRID